PPTPPAIYAPAPREISFGEIRGRVTAGTRIVSIRVDGVYKGYANLDGRRFWRTISLPSRDVTIRITAVNAMGDRASSSVGPVYVLSRAARPRAIKGSLDRGLQRKIRALVDAFPGTSGVYVQDLRTGQGAARDEPARFMGASTLKLGIAIEVLRVLGGKPPADSRIGSLFRRMLVYSDNAPSNRSPRLVRRR